MNNEVLIYILSFISLIVFIIFRITLMINEIKHIIEAKKELDNYRKLLNKAKNKRKETKIEMDKIDLYEKLLKEYGDKQIVVAIEELSELQKELCKHLRGKTNIQNLLEEIADVKIMLEQICLYFELDDFNINYVMNEKLKRTQERLID